MIRSFCGESKGNGFGITDSHYQRRILLTGRQVFSQSGIWFRHGKRQKIKMRSTIMFFRKYPPEYIVIAVFIAIGLVLQLTALFQSDFSATNFYTSKREDTPPGAIRIFPRWSPRLPGYKICLTPIPYLSIIYSTLRLPQWRFCSAVWRQSNWEANG